MWFVLLVGRSINRFGNALILKDRVPSAVDTAQKRYRDSSWKNRDTDILGILFALLHGYHHLVEKSGLSMCG